MQPGDKSNKNKSQPEALDFARKASGAQTGFLVELWLFLRENRKWWLAPLVAILLVFGVLVVLGETSVAPFIYTLF